MRVNLRFSALAMDFAMEVLPTPGGPTRQMMGLFNLSDTTERTARYSIRRFFTSSMP